MGERAGARLIAVQRGFWWRLSGKLTPRCLRFSRFRFVYFEYQLRILEEGRETHSRPMDELSTFTMTGEATFHLICWTNVLGMLGFGLMLAIMRRARSKDGTFDPKWADSHFVTW